MRARSRCTIIHSFLVRVYTRFMTRGRKPGHVIRRCELEDCDKHHYGHGYCEMHYKRWVAHGDPAIVITKERPLCDVVGCTRLHQAKGLCASHYKRWKESGERPASTISPKSFRGLRGPCLREGCVELSRGSGYCAKHYARLASLINKYGIKSFDEFDAFWRQAEGKCEVCGMPVLQDGPEVTRLHIDHDHTTGVVRGILCRACNQGIGQFKDTPELLDAGAAYLRRERRSMY